MKNFARQCMAAALVGLAVLGQVAWAASDSSNLSEQDSAEMKEQVRAVVLQNKAARQGIESYSMKIDWKRREFPETPLDAPLPEGRVISYGEGIWMEKGSMFHVHRTKRWERRDAANAPSLPSNLHGLESNEYSSWAVYNGEYFAEHNSKLPGRIRLSSRDVLDAGLMPPDAFLFPYPLKWGFGYGTGYLDTEYEKSLALDGRRWEREDLKTPAGPRIKLSRFTRISGTAQEARTDFVVAPEQGFLLASTATWNPSGVQILQLDITLAPVGDGRWYPSRAVRRRVDDFHEYTFTEVTLNPDLDDALFTIDAFDLDYAATRIHQRKAGGGQTRLLFRDGQWIPESLVPKHQRPVLPGDEIRYTSK